jgi:DNA-binding transcriptional LysR family regulator
MGTIDLDDLGVFVAVVETESFSGAAARLRVPKSSVSRAIARLEAAMNVRLLHRTTRRVSVSTAGRALYEKVRGEIASLRHAVGELPELEEELSGQLRVSAVVDMSEYLAEVVSKFASRYRRVEIDLRLTNDYVDIVAEGIDVALRFATKRLKDSSLHARKIGPCDVSLFASPSYLARNGTPRTPRELERHEWVVYRRATQFTLENDGRSAVIVSRGRIVADDLTFVRSALVSGSGIGYLTPILAESDLTAGRLVRVLPGWRCPISNLWAVWPSARMVPRKVTAFVDIVAESFTSRIGK